MSKKYRIYTDGGARGNPGPAGIGGVIQEFNEKLNVFKTKKTVKDYIGKTTNNQAEYRALIKTLEAASGLKIEEVECLLDSELVVKQLNHEYRVKDKDLAPLFLKVWNLSGEFKKISFKHIPREQNVEADQLVNQAIDEALLNGV